MADQPRTRQELYDRIRETSKEEVVLEEMIRLGFWPAQGRLPSDPADEIRRRAELQHELDRLREQNRRLHNEQALLRELRKRRLLESRAKQLETKHRRERERLARAAAWRAKQEKSVVYLGPGVSAGLGNTVPKLERLLATGLPQLKSAAELAAALGITVGALRFLAFSRRTSTVSHYVRFRLPKKSGGERTISAPMPRLKRVQHWLLSEVLEKIGIHESAHGFRIGRSIVSNAAPHLGRDVIVNVDLKDFFPTVGYGRVKGLFRSLGYSEEVATLLGLLCTEPEIEEVTLDGRKYFVAQSGRHLPQGAPTSPAITNLLCRRLDRRLLKMATELGFTYSRYADDLTFSASGDSVGQVGEVLSRLRSIVAHEGFVVHPDKTRVLRRGGRQEVTGIVVNTKPNLARDTLRRFRATLFQIEKDGPAGKRWGVGRDVLGSLRGFANYVRMVNPEKGTALLAQVQAICAKWGPASSSPPSPPPAPRHPPPPASAPPTSAGSPEPSTSSKEPEPAPTDPTKKWWKLF